MWPKKHMFLINDDNELRFGAGCQIVKKTLTMIKILIDFHRKTLERPLVIELQEC